MRRWGRRNAWVLVAAMASLVLTVQQFRDTDVWWHLALGRDIVAHGIPAVEPFSYLHAANPWIGQQWLYEVVLARLVDAGGAGLASLVLGLCGSGAFLLAMLSIPPARRPRGPWSAAALLGGCLVAAQLLGVRGQVVSLLGAAAVLYVISRWRGGATRAVIALPPLFLVWANLHAGFITGLGILVVTLLVVRRVDSPARRALLVALVASVLATLVNPAGPRLWGYVASTFNNPTLTNVVTEWRSPDFHDPLLRLFEVSAIAVVALWYLAPRRDALDLTLAALTFTASLQAQRNVSLFALVAAPQLAVYGSAAWHRHRHRLTRAARPLRTPPPWWFGAAIAVVVAAASVATVVPQLTSATTARYERTHEPAAAADWLAGHAPGQRIYSTDTIGGYLAYRFPAGRVVYLYDETAIFGNAALRRYLVEAQLQDDWQTLFTSGGVHLAVLPDDNPMVSALLAIGWTPSCRDSLSHTLVMRAGASAGIVAIPTPASSTPFSAIALAPTCSEAGDAPRMPGS